MASPKRVPNSTPSATRSKLAERVAFDPFLPQEDLLNELIRNMINPDSDLGQNYYVGIITNVVKKDDPQIEIRDIWSSRWLFEVKGERTCYWRINESNQYVSR